MKKSSVIMVSVFWTLLLLAAASGFIIYGMLYVPHDTADLDRSLTISNGESLTSVAYRLEARGMIRSALALQLYSRFTGQDVAVQKGSYIVPENLSALDTLAYLSSGRQSLVRVTIPEGKTLRQVAEIFQEAGVISAGEFRDAAMNEDLMRELGIPGLTAEGYLFPDTYYFAQDFPAEKIVSHMVQVFFERLDGIYPEWEQLSTEELHEKLILASIVEREYRSADEAPLMASVFYNRLERGMRLESCATVVYVMTEIEGLEHPSRIFFADLERPNDFNTYYRSGLPPAPIAGVGEVALEAAFYPAESDYLFFVLESPNATEHVFSTDYDDHLLASQFYYIKLN